MFDVQSLPEAPTLHPTHKQFMDFAEYVSSIEQQYRHKHGMVKIVPPSNWQFRGKNYNKILKQLQIDTAEYQILVGNKNSFYFQCQNKRLKSTLTLTEYQKIAEEKRQEICHLRNLKEIQAHFWKHLGELGQELYCTNIPKSLMGKEAGSWNFANLRSAFSQLVTEPITGLNSPFLFVGAYRTFFNWHIQDLDLSAINLVHEGAPKIWYGVPPHHRRTLQRILRDNFQEQAINCTNFLRHKSTFTNPYLVKQRYPSLQLTKMTQGPGEICLVFSEAYHCGFNTGYNVAEAINHGNSQWLMQYMKFKGCKCPKAVGVQLDLPLFHQNIFNSSYLDEVKHHPTFQKIEQAVQQQEQADKAFEQADSDQLFKEISVAKEKKINKGKREVFVEKYNRYFPLCEQVQCNRCKEWRSVSKNIQKQYENKLFRCAVVGKECRKNTKKTKGYNKRNKNSEKNEKKEKVELSKRVLRSRSKRS